MLTTVENSNFLNKSIPQLHPASIQYQLYWMEEKRKCIEGSWVSGKWMPGKLYFYVNLGTILKNVKNSKVKFYGRPDLRDLEWEFFPIWEEARGFSGFIGDPYFSADRLLLNPELTDDDLRAHSDFMFKPDGVTRKEYVPAREYIRRIHADNYGRPLYENDSKNLLMMGPRGFGKSYSVGAGIVAAEFLFDGITHYIPPSEWEDNMQAPAANTIVTAGDAKYSNDILAKTKVCIENLPGAIELDGVTYPSPLYKLYKGSWMPGKQIESYFKVKRGGNWIEEGTGTTIKNRTFKDNPYAIQGNRAGVVVYEEIGMFDNLKSAYENSVDVMKDGSYKFGSAMFLGTGGDMERGTLDAYYMFYHPQEYDLLEFEDVWEYKGKISYFVPAYYGDNKFKDSNGNTNVEAALKYEKEQRKKLAGDKGASSTLDSYIVYHPLVPSEIFLVRNMNVFPVAELKRRREELDKNNVVSLLEKRVQLYYDPKGFYNGVSYSIDVNNELKPIREFPYNGKDREGCTVIYEFPIIDEKTGEVPQGMYIIGHDPYATDDPSGPSLASIYVLKTRKHKYKYGHDEVVAEYVGRPFKGRRVVNDILLKLSLMYGNAKVYFENVRGNVKEYFEKHKKLHLLATQPTTVFSNKASTTQPGAEKVYGYPMSDRKNKVDALLYTADWLLQERGTNAEGNPIRNLDLIPSPGLLDEFIYFNMEGNFDRVMGFLGCVIGMEEIHNQYEEELLEREGLTRQNKLEFLADNKSLFPKAVHNFSFN